MIERDFIQGERFAELANGKDICYSHTHELDFNNLPDKEFILITHNSSKRMDMIPPDNVIKWYSQDVGIIHDKVESIPLGLENNIWFPKLRKRKKMIAKSRHSKRLRNLMYINFSITTNLRVRAPLYGMFANKKWVSSVRGKNGNGFDAYLNNIYNHKFVLSPEGAGVDTVRTWECLYLGTIPIEKRNINNQFYTDLPICFVDDWEEVTENFLESEYVRIKKSTWNMDKLKFSYWKDKILAA